MQMASNAALEILRGDNYRVTVLPMVQFADISDETVGPDGDNGELVELGKLDLDHVACILHSSGTSTTASRRVQNLTRCLQDQHHSLSQSVSLTEDFSKSEEPPVRHLFHHIAASLLKYRQILVMSTYVDTSLACILCRFSVSQCSLP